MNEIMPGVSKDIAAKYGILDSPIERLFARMEKFAESGGVSGFADDAGYHLNYIAGAVTSMLPNCPPWPESPGEKPTHYRGVALNAIQRDIAKTVAVHPELCEIGILYADNAVPLETRKNVEDILRGLWRSLGEREKSLDAKQQKTSNERHDPLKTAPVSRLCQKP